jgi:hypothetical protein
VLDPAVWIRNTTLIERAPEPVELTPVRSEIAVSNVQSRIERAVDKYLTAPSASGHDGFMGLARSLQRAGLDLDDIRSELVRAAAIRSRTKTGFDGVMKTLTKPYNG